MSDENLIECAVCHATTNEIYEETGLGHGISCFFFKNSDGARLIGCYGSVRHDMTIMKFRDGSVTAKNLAEKDALCDDCVTNLLNSNELFLEGISTL